ncbi:DUF4825 domain-containing protein [Clostridium botulinum]|nr:DUF4825 domain-containing protein [Clostridium botulinum]
MNSKNKIIVFLIIMGIILFSVVNFVIIPQNTKKNNEYMSKQNDPITHDLNSVLEYKNEYMGNASNIANLYNDLPLKEVNKSFELVPEKLKVEINYKETVESIGELQVKKALIYNSTIAFALIDNIKEINYNFVKSNYKVCRQDMEKWYGEELSKLLENNKWKSKVQDKLNNEDHVDKFINEIFNVKSI